MGVFMAGVICFLIGTIVYFIVLFMEAKDRIEMYEIKSRHEFGRGYAHFGHAVSSKQKDNENLEILSNW